MDVPKVEDRVPMTPVVPIERFGARDVPENKNVQLWYDYEMKCKIKERIKVV